MDNESKVLAVIKQESRPLNAKDISDLTGLDKKKVLLSGQVIDSTFGAEITEQPLNI